MYGNTDEGAKESPPGPDITPAGGGGFSKADELNPVVGTCQKCGIKLHQIMRYVCPSNQCPCHLNGGVCI